MAGRYRRGVRLLLALVLTVAVAPPRPAVDSKPIPFGAQRRAETARYAERHYGLDTWRLQHPKVIVEHYTASTTLLLGVEHIRERRARRRAARAARARARTS